MQASPAWTPPTGTLGSIVAEARDARRSPQAERARAGASRPPRAPAVPSLAAALRGESVAVIAEVKRRSPSKGWINPGLSAADQARAYERGGAAAISVLTEPAHFGGSVDDLVAVRDAVGVAGAQEGLSRRPDSADRSQALGASAALLIARALAPDALARDDRRRARRCRSRCSSKSATRTSSTRALEVRRDDHRHQQPKSRDARHRSRRRPSDCCALIPPAIIAIAESGVAARADVERVARRGADAVLVGSVFSAAADAAAGVAQLTGVPRIGRDALTSSSAV